VSRSWRSAIVAILLAGALVAVGWMDYRSTRQHFMALVRAQASSVHHTVAAAARANRVAAADAQAALVARLLETARLLAALHARGGLTSPTLEAFAARNPVFRVHLLSAEGTREQLAAPAGYGRGQGGPRRGAGFGAGGGPSITALADELLRDGRSEAVTELHLGRRDSVARLAAGVRRADGGALLVSVDATDVADLQQQRSLDHLLADIVQRTGDIAYVVFEQDAIRRAQGDVPDGAPDTWTPSGGDHTMSERALEVNGRPVLELTGPIDLGDGQQAHLHLGMRLDGLRAVEGQRLSRLALTLSSAAALGVLALGLVSLRRQYGSLSLAHARAQDALRRRDRLAAMGELASTVAHEIRNPLNAIAMSAQRLQRECLSNGGVATTADATEASTLVGVIRQEAQRINTKVQQFLDFARPPALTLRPVRLDTWLASVASLIAPVAAAKDITLRTAPGPEVEVRIDADQLRQALENLLRNAIDATPPGGTITVAATATPQECVLEVRDTGEGIPPEHVGKIFDLYFTTKARGTGVGLAVTQQIVGAHGGTIDVDSAPGRGTSMRIRVPRDAGEPGRA
jgi:signal transduction histidine kinase